MKDNKLQKHSNEIVSDSESKEYTKYSNIVMQYSYKEEKKDNEKLEEIKKEENEKNNKLEEKIEKIITKDKNDDKNNNKMNEEKKEEEKNIEKESYEDGGNIINNNSELKINLEKPNKKNENDLEIKARFVSISKIDKIRILTISFSNNEVYFYDLNKIIKYEEIENKKENKKEISEEKEIIKNNYIKKYGKIEYNIPEKITALDSELTKI